MRATIVFVCIGILIGIMPARLRAQPETFSLITDKPFYITGQSIWYSITSTNYNAVESHSEVVYFNVHDKGGKPVAQQKLRLVDGQANGMLLIPYSWQEDYYYFTCFTQWNLQFDSGQCYWQKIAIYDASKTQEVIELLRDNEGIVRPPAHFISTDKAVYTRRESVTLRFNNIPRGNYTVSVIPFEEYLAGKQIADSLRYAISIRYARRQHVTRESGITLEGSVLDAANRQPVTSDLLLLYRKGSNEFRRVTASSGNMTASLGWYNGSEDYQLCNMNPYEPMTPVLDIRVPGGDLIVEREIDDKPPRTAVITQIIRNEKLRNKVSELFPRHQADTVIGSKFSPIPFRSDKVYQMEKYKGMKTLEEFFREIVFMADLSTKNNQLTIRLKNTETQQFFMESPWFLVDGLLTRDTKSVLGLPFKNLVRVELMNTTKSILSQLDALMVRSGLIVIYTDGNVHPAQYPQFQKAVRVAGLSAAPVFESTHQLTPEKPHENPVLRSTIYWNPNVSVTPGFELTFQATDDLGNFVILVSGVTDEGLPVNDEVTFKVTY